VNDLTVFIHDATVATATAAGPIFLLMLLLGLLLGVLQAATQVNDPSVSFLPKVFAGGLALLLMGPWMLERFVIILRMAFEKIGIGP
jgi:flagellar biosynthetic protein FliQ